MLMSLLQFDAGARITAEEAIALPYFDRIKAQHGYMPHPSPGEARVGEKDAHAPFNLEEEKLREHYSQLKRNVSAYLIHATLTCTLTF